MDTGEFLTRSTIWVSIVGYAVGSVIFALPNECPSRLGTKVTESLGRTQWESAARILWTVACASLIAHFISAFHFYHGWSHQAAYADTAQQTQELFGLHWGGGLFINYALLLAWIVDLAWWWRTGLESYRKRPWPLIAAWHGILIFIIFNATVVFGEGIVRWLGFAICLLLTLHWLRTVSVLGHGSVGGYVYRYRAILNICAPAKRSVPRCKSRPVIFRSSGAANIFEPGI